MMLVIATLLQTQISKTQGDGNISCLDLLQNNLQVHKTLQTAKRCEQWRHAGKLA